MPTKVTFDQNKTHEQWDTIEVSWGHPMNQSWIVFDVKWVTGGVVRMDQAEENSAQDQYKGSTFQG